MSDKPFHSGGPNTATNKLPEVVAPIDLSPFAPASDYVMSEDWLNGTAQKPICEPPESEPGDGLDLPGVGDALRGKPFHRGGLVTSTERATLHRCSAVPSLAFPIVESLQKFDMTSMALPGISPSDQAYEVVRRYIALDRPPDCFGVPATLDGQPLRRVAVDAWEVVVPSDYVDTSAHVVIDRGYTVAEPIDLAGHRGGLVTGAEFLRLHRSRWGAGPSAEE